MDQLLQCGKPLPTKSISALKLYIFDTHVHQSGPMWACGARPGITLGVGTEGAAVASSTVDSVTSYTVLASSCLSDNMCQ